MEHIWAGFESMDSLFVHCPQPRAMRHVEANSYFGCGTCGISFIAELNSKRCESQHSALLGKETFVKDDKRRPARVAKSQAGRKQAVKTRLSLEVGDKVAPSLAITNVLTLVHRLTPCPPP